MRHCKFPVFFALLSIFCFGFSGMAFGYSMNPQTPVVLNNSGQFISVDLDRNGQPDQLGYKIKALTNQPGEVWVSGELQSLVDGEWFTINYTAVPFEWDKGEHTATLQFYGGELRRLRADGPFRILVGVRQGLWEKDNQVTDISTRFPWDEWQTSDIAAADGPVTRASMANGLAEAWAKKEHKELGALTDKTFTFDRWRMDYTGTAQDPPRRLWVDPSGEIFSADQGK
jgi:hypothetical protein